jgi:small nuclear ribonucleoprotein (snRNP)-like protein
MVVEKVVALSWLNYLLLVKGILRGSDALVNLVLESCVEFLRGMLILNAFSYILCLLIDPDDLYKKSNATRQLGTNCFILFVVLV